MANFELALKKTLENEGGYVNDRNDNGGETYCGVSRKFHPEWEGWMIIDEAKKTIPPRKFSDEQKQSLQKMLADFYRANFWSKINGDSILDQQLAEKLFDMCVLCGISNPCKILQKSINEICEQNDYKVASLICDGKIGRSSLQLLNSISLTKISELRDLFIDEMRKYFKSLKNNENFLRGWLARVVR